MWPGLAARLEGRVVVLEPLVPEHKPGLLEAARGSDWDYMFYRAAATSEIFHGWVEDALASQDVTFTTLDAASGKPIGSTRYLALRPEHRGLEIGWTWLARSAWGTGANVEAKLLMLEHAFERHDCIRVEFKTDARNERSRGALAALPAQFEGVFRKHMLVGEEHDRLRDSAYYSITDEEWPAVRGNLERRLGRIAGE